MSDFLFSSQRVAPDTLRQALERQLDFVTDSVREYHGEWGSLAVARACHDDEPAFETDGALSVVVGRPMLHSPNGGRALLDSSNRHRAHQLLADSAGKDWDTLLDGVFVAMHIDKVSGAAHVVTDMFAWIPVFAGGTIVGTHVDSVADALGIRDQIDEVSAADLLANSTIVWPHTMYRDIVQLPPASVTLASGLSTPYWQPTEANEFSTLNDAAEALRSELCADLAAAVDGRHHIGILLSGGEDSRALLGALPDRSHVTAYTYAPSHNREVRAAERVARAFGVQHRHGVRPESHDLVHFEPAARLASTQNEFRDVHSYGLHEQLGLMDLAIVVEGFSSDALLKADNVPPRLQRMVLRGGRAERPLVMSPLRGIRRELLVAALERREQHRALLRRLRPESADEWRYIWPYSMRRYAANIHGNRRLFRIHEPFMSNGVARIAAAAPQRWKIGRRLFSRAMHPLLRPTWHVPHSRNRMPYFGKRVNAIARPLLGLARDTRDVVTGQRTRNQESWPLWDELVKTELMARKVAQYPLERSAIRGVFEDVSAIESWPALHQLAVLQLAYLTQ
jgi:hypothetical protein